MPSNFSSGSGKGSDNVFRARWEKAVRGDMGEKVQFDYAGSRVACYGNMDVEEVFVVDPDTFAYIGKPQLDVEYPMLRMGVNNTSCSFFRDAMISRSVDDKMRELCGMTAQRDWYDATMLVRVSERPENVIGIGGVQRKAPPKRCPGESAEIVQLFPVPD